MREFNTVHVLGYREIIHFRGNEVEITSGLTVDENEVTHTLITCFEYDI